MKLVKRVSHPQDPCAIDQGGVWLVDDSCPGTNATKAQVDAVTIPHPDGDGRKMLRQIPAGTILIEVSNGKSVPHGGDAPKETEAKTPEFRSGLND